VVALGTVRARQCLSLTLNPPWVRPPPLSLKHHQRS
jgi:hypothetical protein